MTVVNVDGHAAFMTASRQSSKEALPIFDS